MRKNNVRTIRKQAGLTIEQLAAKVGISQPYLTRIESGGRRLSVQLAEQIAMALNSHVTDVLGVQGGQIAAGLAEEAEAYTPQAGDDIALRARDNVVPWLVKSTSLDAVGIEPGMIVLVDVGTDAVENIKPLQFAVVQAYEAGSLKATTVLRQFVPPGLLITNSRTANAVPFNTETDDVAIKGVIVGSYRRLGGV